MLCMSLRLLERRECTPVCLCDAKGLGGLGCAKIANEYSPDP
jgi:hypothetical protein